METQTITPVEHGELADLLNKTFTTTFHSSYIKVRGCVLPKEYEEFADATENFQVRDDDVWVCSFPKSGTTWVQEMVWCIANDLEFEKAEAPLLYRFPYFELSALFSTREFSRRNPEVEIPDLTKDSVAYIADQPGRRFIKSHLPANLLPRQMRDGEKKPKIIFVVRNPKDTCISFYHYAKLIEGFNGNFEEFSTLFLGDTIQYAPYWKHVLGFWNKRNDENVLFLKYEDMKKDLSSVIRETARFLGKNLTNDQILMLNEHLSFSNMKANPSVNYEDHVVRTQRALQVKREGAFFRIGKSEQWKTDMTPELVEQFDEWIEENLKGTGLSL